MPPGPRRLGSLTSGATASASSAAVGRVATIRAYAERLVVCAGAVIAEHARCFDRNQVLYNPWHDVEALERKPGAPGNGAPFKDSNLLATGRASNCMRITILRKLCLPIASD